MKETEIQDDLSSIRSLMERSSKFISLSGLSGVLAGVYALIGSGLAYKLLEYTAITGTMENYKPDAVPALVVIALAVLFLSITTCIMLSARKAKKRGQSIWGSASRAVFFNMAVPLFAGGVLMLILLARGYFGIVAPASLIFYGIALVNASNFTFKDVRYLGFCEIALGLITAWLPGYGLLFWAFGFGVLHIVYGSIMYIKYDR